MLRMRTFSTNMRTFSKVTHAFLLYKSGISSTTVEQKSFGSYGLLAFEHLALLSGNIYLVSILVSCGD